MYSNMYIIDNVTYLRANHFRKNFVINSGHFRDTITMETINILYVQYSYSNL